MTIQGRLDAESAAALEEMMGLGMQAWQAGPAPSYARPAARSQQVEQLAPWEYGTYPSPEFYDPERVIGTPDFRRVLNTTDEPFRHVCKIETTGGVGRGTGTLIRGNKVLTAAHVVHDFKSTPGNLRIIPAQREAGTSTTARPFGTALGTKVDMPTSYGHVANTFEGDDYAIITIDRDIGHHWRRIRALDPARVRSATVNVCGYPGTPGGGQQIFRSYGRVVGVSGTLLEYDNDTSGGMSGSPVWLRWRDTRTLIGVHQIGDDGVGPEANRAVFITPAVLTQINSWL